MKINGGEARVGTIIKYDGDIYKVVKSQHVKPGKGGAYNQVELKGVISGTKKNERLRSDEKVEKVVLEQKELTYLYFDGDFYVHMDDNTYDQISLAPSEIAEDQSNIALCCCCGCCCCCCGTFCISATRACPRGRAPGTGGLVLQFLWVWPVLPHPKHGRSRILRGGCGHCGARWSRPPQFTRARSPEFLGGIAA